MLLGDLHGNTEFALKTIRRAKKLGCKMIFQMGDFGIWPDDSGRKFLDIVDRELQNHGMLLQFVDGNHDCSTELKTAPTPYLRKNIFHLQRGTRFWLNGVGFLAMGGAASSDQHLRKPGIDWWAGETIGISDVSKAGKGIVDVVLCHDMSSKSPLKRKLLPGTPVYVEAKIKSSRSHLDKVIKDTLPTLVVHGHMHTELFTPNDERCSFNQLALGADVSSRNRAWAIVEIEDGEVNLRSYVRGLNNIDIDLLADVDPKFLSNVDYNNL